MKNTIKNLIWLGLLLLLASCSSWVETNKFIAASLNGKIYDMDNTPCPNVKIYVDGNLKTMSDINGRFTLTELQQGDHILKFEKEDYKTEIVDISFLNKNQVIFQRLIYIEQIIKEVEMALDKKEWKKAGILLSDALRINPRNPIVNYLYGLFYYKLNKPEQAIEFLKTVLDIGYEEPIVYLTLSNIYEMKLKDLEQAVYYLQKYLDQKDDREEYLKMQILKTKLPKKPEASPEPETAPTAETTE